MKKIKKLLSLLPVLLLWAFISAFLWTWIFSFLTDTVPEKKLTLYADVPAMEGTALAVRLEAEDFPGIRMVQARMFSQVLFDTEALRKADLYIIPLSRAEEYRDAFAPLPEAFAGEAELLLLDGVPYGIPVYTPGGGTDVAGSYIRYAVPGAAEEPYYLVFGARSVHLAGNEGAADSLAAELALALLRLN